MTNCIFYSLFFVLFLNFSFGSLRMSQINRSFESSYKSVYEASIITVGEDGEPIYPYYSQEILRNNLNSFINENVGKFVNAYDLTLDFYLEDGVTQCKENYKSRCVRVSLDASINYLFKYSKVKTYMIKERTKL